MMEHTAEAAYDAFAPIYDDFNHRNDYEMWLGVLLPELEKRGLRRGRMLDVGCGTGRAFEPMLRRGWEIQGCDVSAGMLEQARRKFGDRVPLAVADARELPVFGEFELAIALNDVVNYLVEDGDLERAFAAVRANLADDGMLLFDCNSLGLFRADFASGNAEDMSVGEWVWEGISDRAQPGEIHEARVWGGGVAEHIHRERHYSGEEIRAALGATGFEFLAALGQREESDRVVLVEPADEINDHKIICISRAAS